MGALLRYFILSSGIIFIINAALSNTLIVYSAEFASGKDTLIAAYKTKSEQEPATMLMSELIKLRQENKPVKQYDRVIILAHGVPGAVMEVDHSTPNSRPVFLQGDVFGPLLLENGQIVFHNCSLFADEERSNAFLSQLNSSSKMKKINVVGSRDFLAALTMPSVSFEELQLEYDYFTKAREAIYKVLELNRAGLVDTQKKIALTALEKMLPPQLLAQNPDVLQASLQYLEDLSFFFQSHSANKETMFLQQITALHKYPRDLNVLYEDLSQIKWGPVIHKKDISEKCAFRFRSFEVSPLTKETTETFAFPDLGPGYESFNLLRKPRLNHQ